MTISEGAAETPYLPPFKESGSIYRLNIILTRFTVLLVTEFEP